MQNAMLYKNIQLPQLRSFCLVATHENFAETAKELGLSRPTVWQQVRALERELRVSLLRRRGRGVALTPEGRLLLELVQPHVSGLDSLARLFESRRAEMQQQLTVASTHYLLSYHLPQSVEAFAAQRPRAGLHLRACMWPEVIRLVERGQVDLGLVPFVPEEPRSASLDYEQLFELHFTLITAARHPLARKRKITPADLVEYPLILGPPEGYDRKVLEGWLRKHDLLGRMHVIMESHSLDVNRKYVALGIGITLSHLGPAISRAMPELHLRPVDPALPSLPVAIVLRKDAHLPGLVDEFRQHLRQFLPPAAQ